MTAQDKADWQTGKDLDGVGYEVRPPAVRLHGSQETPKHLVLKALVVRELQKRGHKWDTEVKGPNGRVDVLDFGLTDDAPVVYEIQTDCTPQERREKAEQYAVGPVRDVLFLDPSDAPDEIGPLTDWVAERVIG